MSVSRKVVAAVLMISTLSVGPRAARAEEPSRIEGAPESAPPPSTPAERALPASVTRHAKLRELATVERRYGTETLAADAISVGVLVGSLFLPSTKGVLPALGLGGYMLAAPAVHLSHGNPGRALGSLGLRLVLPLGLGAVGFYLGLTLTTKQCQGYSCLGGIVVGGLLGLVGAVGGMVTVSVLDAAVLARESIQVKRAAAFVRLSPYLVPAQRGADFGLTAFGRF